jgi:carbon monoxide dehydrogenase subunit G
MMAVLLIVGLALPGAWRTERSIRIDAEPDTVFALVADFQHWQDWYIAFEHDPAMNTTYSDPPHGTGAFFDWSGNAMVGRGRLAFEKVTPPRSIDLRIDMNDGRFIATGGIVFAEAEGGTRVAWHLGGDLGKDPFARINRSMLQNAVGGTLQANLDKLKAAAEAR